MDWSGRGLRLLYVGVVFFGETIVHKYFLMLLLAALPMAIVGCGGGEESGGDGEEAAAVQPEGTPVVVSLPNMT